MLARNQERHRARWRPFLVLALVGLTAACATKPPPDDPQAVAHYRQANDPLEPMNRAIYGFNDVLWKGLLQPTAKGYRTVVPDPMQDMIRNVLRNLAAPLRLINNVLQGDVDQASVTLGRFMTNSTIGFAGLFDPAQEWGMEYREEDFGQTLAVWGGGEGAYLILPILGPASIRYATGMVGDFLMDPVSWILRAEDLSYLNIVRTGIEGLDEFTGRLDEIEEVQRDSLDPYASFRSLHRQIRTDLIHNGAPPDRASPGEPAIFEDFPEYE